jgi:glycine/D-amino acid oxidase-like deaminating enzyme
MARLRGTGTSEHRRNFLKCLAGLVGSTALGHAWPAGRSPDQVVIVGGGILGASLAYHLSRRGAEITLLEKEAPAAGATSRSFAWINADFSKQPFDYHILNKLGVWAYRLLEQQLLGLPVEWGGCLQWYVDEARAEQFARQLRQLEEWGYDVRAVSEAEFHSLEPDFRPGKILAASFAEQEGFANPTALTEVFLKEARKAGAAVIYPCEVTGLELQAGRIRSVKTTKGEFPAGVLILAAGVGTPALAAMAGVHVPLIPAPGLLVHTKPMPALAHRVLIGPDAHFKQYREGGMVIGDDFRPPKDAVHETLNQHPLDFPDDAARELHEQRILKQAAAYLPAAEKAPVEKVTLGWRPMPKDGFPILGPAGNCPNLYIAVTHSGVTLASILGELVTQEILDRVSVRMLEPYRLSRFQE